MIVLTLALRAPTLFFMEPVESIAKTMSMSPFTPSIGLSKLGIPTFLAMSFAISSCPTRFGW
ncbi:hypothetical protein HMPREF1979_00168 [Actinomyces johnsonii F0542]|uniref:Uncharacterized protein n=1 Tax=Actinomyces johnsonii F0542 TaxID=1321818 RepID=U1S1E6_9ACTO|nr:hypothetical protein HMPREF1979_00168 [Actinomyces johnsonii F0542]